MWFKVDDGFYDHPKVTGLPMAARGLWVTAGSYCGRHLTDGVISAKQVRMLGGTKAQIRALIEHGLWVELKGDCGAIRYAFHDWNEQQPTSDQVKKKRESSRERQAKSRANRTQENASTSEDTKMSRCDIRRESRRESRCESHPVSRVTSRGRARQPDPTRPNSDLDKLDHTPPNPLKGAPEPGSGKTTTRYAYPTEFETFWAAYPRRVGKRKALTAWRNATKRATPETILAGAKRLASDPNLPEERYVPHPTTWLNRDGWDDAPQAARNELRPAETHHTPGTRPEDWDHPTGHGNPWSEAEIIDMPTLRSLP